MGCRDRTREATRGNANRGETYPPAVHADARHYTELIADSGLHAPFFVALLRSLPGLTFEDTNQGGGCTSRALTVVGQKAGTGL